MIKTGIDKKSVDSGGPDNNASSSVASSTTKVDQPTQALPEPQTLLEIRNSPGRASGGLNLPEVNGQWLKGTDGNLGTVPKQIANDLNGQQFKTFNDFKQSFWKSAAKDPNLSSQFSKANLNRMSEGLAPIAKQSQHLGGQKSYILHHKTPIQRGGAVYDMNNIVIVTPRLHKEILDGSFDYGK